MSIAVTVGTHTLAETNGGGIYVVYTGMPADTKCTTWKDFISCPKPNCKRIINLTLYPMPGMHRVGCAYCNDTFLFNTLNNCLVRCPHCRKLSSVGPTGPNFARRRGIVLIIFGIIALVMTTLMTVTVGTYIYAVNGTIYLVYFCGFLTGVVSLGHGIYYCTMKNSLIEEIPCSLPNSSEQPVI